MEIQLGRRDFVQKKKNHTTIVGINKDITQKFKKKNNKIRNTRIWVENFKPEEKQ